jgi:hypothetical protein
MTKPGKFCSSRRPAATSLTLLILTNQAAPRLNKAATVADADRLVQLSTALYKNYSVRVGKLASSRVELCIWRRVNG